MLKIEQWVLTPHAAERIQERGISVAELESVILNPDSVIKQGPKLILEKRIKNRKDNNIAAVIIEKKGEKLWVVVTVMVNFQRR